MGFSPIYTDISKKWINKKAGDLVNKCRDKSPLVSIARICRLLPPVLAPRIVEKIYPRQRAMAEKRAFTTASVTGSLFSGATDDIYGYRMAIYGYHEWRNLAIARSVCSAGDVIIEVGANIGTETIGYADIVGPKGKVFAFEPLPENLEVLKTNLDLNQHKHVKVFPYALSNQQKTVFFAPPQRGNSGVGYIREDSSEDADMIAVNCETMDGLQNDLGIATAIFIDAEGSEANILRGAQDYISKSRAFLVVEAHPRHLERYGFSLSELFFELKQLEYVVFRISGTRGLTNVDLDANSGRNWLAIPIEQQEKENRIKQFIKRVGWSPFICGLNPLS